MLVVLLESAEYRALTIFPLAFYELVALPGQLADVPFGSLLHTAASVLLLCAFGYRPEIVLL
jgi:hypothetical protein